MEVQRLRKIMDAMPKDQLIYLDEEFHEAAVFLDGYSVRTNGFKNGIGYPRESVSRFLALAGNGDFTVSVNDNLAVFKQKNITVSCYRINRRSPAGHGEAVCAFRLDKVKDYLSRAWKYCGELVSLDKTKPTLKSENGNLFLYGYTLHSCYRVRLHVENLMEAFSFEIPIKSIKDGSTITLYKSGNVSIEMDDAVYDIQMNEDKRIESLSRFFDNIGDLHDTEVDVNELMRYLIATNGIQNEYGIKKITLVKNDNSVLLTREAVDDIEMGINGSIKETFSLTEPNAKKMFGEIYQTKMGNAQVIVCKSEDEESITMPLMEV